MFVKFSEFAPQPCFVSSPCTPCFVSSPHTPCFTLIEQALSVFFNVNYI